MDIDSIQGFKPYNADCKKCLATQIKAKKHTPSKTKIMPEKNNISFKGDFSALRSILWEIERFMVQLKGLTPTFSQSFTHNSESEK